MKCEEVRDEMIAYLKGELDEERRKEIDEHLARCHGCQRELELSQRVLFQTQAANEPSVVDMADNMIKEAIQSRATDVHIEPTRDGADIRCRIDGVLHPIRQLSVQERDALVARIKTMGEMSVTESRIPQDGRISTQVEDREYDLRVSTIPVFFGEKVTMRILDRGVPFLGLDKMGFTPEQFQLVKGLLRQPTGMVISTGPAGSGKTTLLYSMILEIANPSLSIVTIEDPVEYLLPGTQQTQVNPRVGLTFASAIRSYLRQDPDVIGIGELRDAESVRLAAEAAMTGHLVLSQMLISDAVSIPQNMVAYGVDPWIVGRNLAGVIACRLVRKVCEDCKEEYDPSDDALEFLGLKSLAGKRKFFHGTGCEACKNIGYRGRAQLHEVLVIDKELGKLISGGEVDPDVLLRQAVSNGFFTMIEDAKGKALEGITTAEEAHRVLA